MSENEMLAIAIGGFAGYWGVMKLLGRRGAQRSDDAAAGEQATPDSLPHVEQPVASSGCWWAVLQIDPAASMQEIQLAYKKRISEYHPDKVANLGEELQGLAEKKSKEINRAYDEARQTRQ